MGRMIKNYQFKTGSYSVRLPVSNSSVESFQMPVDGQIRFNASIPDLEVFYNSGWNSVAKVGNVSVVTDSFTGDGSTTVFNLSNAYLHGQEANVLVFVNNVYQSPLVSYIFNATTSTSLSFTSAPDLNSSIIVLEKFNSTFAQ